MRYLRTPDSRFENLPGYDFKPHYLNLSDGLRMHYVDENPSEKEVVLLLHGEPSWSYLYRKMIPVFVDAGFRVIAPDLVGFGKSDKPVEVSDYTYSSHLSWLGTFIEQLNLQNIHLFCQDWGGLLGLRLALQMEERFTSITAANTFLPTGAQPPNEAFEKWKTFAANVPEFPVGVIIDRATTSELSPEIIAAYDAPFPDESYKAGARIFPALVPVNLDDPQSDANKKAWKAYSNWTKPFLTLFSDSDPIMRGGEKVFQSIVSGAKGQPHEIIENGGHFLQEDKGEEIAKKVLAFIRAI